MRALIRALFFSFLLVGLLHGASEEQLAGDNDVTPTPGLKPTTEAPDQNGPIALSRSAATGEKPNFELPTFVITGGGERKAVAARQSLNLGLDTSGGIKTNPSDKGASKSQVGAQAQRQSLVGTTETAIPSYGQFHLLYGLQNTLEAGAFYGQEIGPFYYLLKGEHDSSDGGPADVPVATLNQSDQSEGEARGGYRQDDGSAWGLDLDARQRDRFETFSNLPNPLMSRSLDREALNWDSEERASTRVGLRLNADQGAVQWPGLGTAYEEDALNFEAQINSEVLTQESRTELEIRLYGGQLDQDRGARTAYPLGGSLMARFGIWSGGTLGLGLALDSYQGDINVFSLAPRAEWEQRLGGGLGLWLRFDPSLDLPLLEGSLYDEDPALPGLGNTPSRDSVKLEGGLSAALPNELNLELKGLIRQNDNANFLDDRGQEGLWQETTLEDAQSVVASLDEDMPLGDGFSERLNAAWMTISLNDRPGLMASFSPNFKGETWLDWKSGPWKSSLGVRYMGTRVADLQGDENMPAYFDLRLQAAYAVTSWFSILAEGRNLLGQVVEDFPGYADPSPFAGLGLELRF